ncbi:hypothetical protein CP532_3828 [Ophiocordyceps camponoti-leonardi (nom. inval.)]|nr:hypothetical protein CP532_3828 [Ophiocordyceps camponoti-leonardi (nom. inval.)]
MARHGTEELIIVEPVVSPKWFIPPFVAPPQERLRRPPGKVTLRRRAGTDTKLEYTETVTFRFRTRFITAAAAIHSHIHPHVLHLNVVPSFMERLVRTAANLLPFSLRTRFEALFPEWHLPSRLVLKRYKKEWHREFTTEKATYDRMKPLQGIVVPKCYGEIDYQGTRALLLSDVGGENLATAEGATLEVADLRRMLHDAFSALAQFGVFPDDIKLDNLHVVGDKIIPLDFEIVNENLSDEILASHIEDDVDYLTERYEDNQHFFWTEGRIKVDTGNS